MRAICSIDGCEDHVAGRGWCRWHYYRWYHGKPLIPECDDCGVELPRKRTGRRPLCEVCIAHVVALREDQERGRKLQHKLERENREIERLREVKLKTAACDHCEELFTQKSANQKYCCQRCAKRAKRRNGGSSKGRAKSLVSEYKEILGCTNCGLEGPACIFDPHHLDPAEKEFSLSNAPTPSAAWRELQKCVNLCAVCHRLVEAGYLKIPAAA